MTKQYVNCIIFDNRLRKVVLIKKNRPDWQKGLWNGVGGKIEANETPKEAVVREVKEETGLDIPAFTIHRFLELRTLGGIVHFFTAWLGEEAQSMAATCTDEEVGVFSLDSTVVQEETVGNLLWIIEMAKSTYMSKDKTKFFTVVE